MIFVFARY